MTAPQPPALAPKRILVIRLDRIGDVVLSTPVVQALREAYPHAFIAMMVRPACRELVDGNPYLNYVVLYDKDGAQRSLVATVRFARRLRREAFDTALILHPTHRSHWIPWLAGIPTRIGYDRKSHWLLTHRVPHRKHEGAQHEAQYALEMLRVFGLKPPIPQPIVVVRPEALARVTSVLQRAGVTSSDALVAIHPSASCISKRWMPQRFAEVADRLIEQTHSRIVLVAGSDDRAYAQAVEQAMRHPPINLAGQLSLGELAALLQRCQVLISNDSGPVHIAAAIGARVVAIFGRNQRGLSPQRWGPLGDQHVILHKDVGCVTCLAHECDIAFRCLTSLSVDEVYEAVTRLIAKSPNASSISLH
jgi:heptosyltransferase-2